MRQLCQQPAGGGAASWALCDFRWVQPRLEARKWGLGINSSFDPSLKGADNERLLPPGLFIQLQLSGNTRPPGALGVFTLRVLGGEFYRRNGLQRPGVVLQRFSFTLREG